ncbi:hypothetical protein Tco_0741996 [Tanacetum coccineum]
MEAQQEEQAQELYNRVAYLETHVMDVSGRLEGEFYPAYLTALAGRRWLLTHGMELAWLKRPDMNMELLELHFPPSWHTILRLPRTTILMRLFFAGRTLAISLKRYLASLLDQLSIAIYYADVNAVVGETSLSFVLLNIHNRAEGARKHAAALRRLMVDIVSHPLSSQNLLGEASASAVAFSVDDLDKNEDLGSVVCMPHLEDLHFEFLP